MIPIEKLVPGNAYLLKHQRFGTTKVTLWREPILDRDWVLVRIDSGTLRGINTEWGPGCIRELRKSHCQFSEAKNPKGKVAP